MNNLNKFRKNQLKLVVDLACGINPPEVKSKYEDDIVNMAVAIFQSIKKMEKAQDEEMYARIDLEMIFGIYNSKSLTLNQMYLLHNSKMTNAIIQMLKDGDLKIDTYKIVKKGYKIIKKGDDDEK